MFLSNVIIPFFFPQIILGLVALLGVCLIEAAYLKKGTGITYRQAYTSSLVANLFSTITGYPAAWILWTAACVLTGLTSDALGIRINPAITHSIIQSIAPGATPPGYEPSEAIINAGLAFSLVPCFLASILIENKVLQKRIPKYFKAVKGKKGENPETIRKIRAKNIRTAVVRGNLTTYAVFLALILLTLLF